MAKSKAFEHATTFTSESGWFITTTLSKKEDSTVIKKSTDFTKLDELPKEIQAGLASGEFTIEVQ